MVGTLVDKAARSIGANRLLALAAAYYHDLGKTESPTHFIENQFGISNPHDLLPPEESAELIRNHVLQGVQLAKQYRIPSEVAEGIVSHHGDGQRQTAKAEYGLERQSRHLGIECRQRHRPASRSLQSRPGLPGCRQFAALESRRDGTANFVQIGGWHAPVEEQIVPPLPRSRHDAQTRFALQSLAKTGRLGPHDIHRTASRQCRQRPAPYTEANRDRVEPSGTLAAVHLDPRGVLEPVRELVAAADRRTP